MENPENVENLDGVNASEIPAFAVNALQEFAPSMEMQALEQV